jgi:Tfp pilus assembly protein PilV
MKIFFLKNKSAFSLIEIMVITSIVLVGMIGVMSLLLQNLKAQSINKNRFIAYQMAQEGIELTRAIRDNYAVNNDHLGFVERYPMGSYFYSYNKGLNALSSDEGMVVCLNSEGFYDDFNSCPAGEDTIFRRKIILSDGNDGNNSFLKVSSFVYWTEREQENSYVLETHLYDWY